ncbi:MAG: 30S ribosomal protein S13 [Candidatus Woesearchaeota archaeon]|jgi:small subunit ribosomal protein S13|nr:30S ribosomal protein S13 [Candidatus Woesearchaeota archaeon]
MENKDKTEGKEEQEFKHIVRIGSADLDGNKPMHLALTKLKGVGFIFANAVLDSAEIDRNKKAGYLSKEETEKINKVIENPLEANIPVWMLNRRNDVETGKDMHLTGGDLDFAKENDVKRMKTIRCYKGVRHAFNLPVRGQRTKSNFRRNKGKVMGVKRNPNAKAGKT